MDPASGMQLRRRGSVAGFDVTFSAPKSVSVLFGIGDARIQSAIREAHDQAVIDATAVARAAVREDDLPVAYRPLAV